MRFRFYGQHLFIRARPFCLEQLYLLSVLDGIHSIGDHLAVESMLSGLPDVHEFYGDRMRCGHCTVPDGETCRGENVKAFCDPRYERIRVADDHVGEVVATQEQREHDQGGPRLIFKGPCCGGNPYGD